MYPSSQFKLWHLVLLLGFFGLAAATGGTKRVPQSDTNAERLARGLLPLPPKRVLVPDSILSAPKSKRSASPPPSYTCSLHVDTLVCCTSMFANSEDLGTYFGEQGDEDDIEDVITVDNTYFGDGPIWIGCSVVVGQSGPCDQGTALCCTTSAIQTADDTDFGDIAYGCVDATAS